MSVGVTARGDELHGRAGADHREAEVVGHESERRQRVQRAHTRLLVAVGERAHGVERAPHAAAPLDDERVGDRRAEQLGERDCACGAQVNDRAPRGVARGGRRVATAACARDVDVGARVVGEIRPVHVDERDLGGRLRVRLLRAFVVGPERQLVRVRGRIAAGERGHDRVVEHRQRVTIDEVAPVDALRREDGVVVRLVVVGRVDLVETAPIAGEEHRRRPDAHARRVARDPIGGVPGADEELGRRPRAARDARGGIASGEAYDEAEDGEARDGAAQECGPRHRHRCKYRTGRRE